MSKTCEIVVTLLVTGSLVLDLHYGPYSRFWWQKNNNKDVISNYFPIRVGQTTKVNLNGRDFYVTIVIGNSDNPFAPGFICTSGTFSSRIENNSSAAISNLYASIFSTKQTRFSGPLVIGWNDNNIISRLSQNIPFFPFSFFVGKYQVFIYGIGSWENGGGSGYKASISHKYLDKPAIFISTIENKIMYLKFIKISMFNNSL